MKLTLRYWLPLLFAAALGVGLSACNDDETGTPSISYIRVTNPEASDSLVAAAGQGQMVAIIGNNLQGVQEVWFNDQPTQLIPTLITSTAVLVRVSSQVPSEITNKLRMLFPGGNEVLYDFSVNINPPSISHLKSEWVNEGDEAIIYGDYFYAPVTVTFTGGVEAEVVSVTDTEIKVKVPVGAQSGPIRVASVFGRSESRFWFRDDRNIIASFDIPLAAGVWQGPAHIVSTDPDIVPINGKFIRSNRELTAWPFFEFYGGTRDGDIAIENRNIPADAFDNPANYSLKFEINTLKPLTGATLRVHIGDADGGNLDAQRQSIYYTWEPNIDTNGQWQTVSIPWANIHQGNGLFAYSPTGYSMFMYFHGPTPSSAYFGLDNMRVVPN